MFYIIDNDNVMISASKEMLETYNEYIQDLPEDYEWGKYIIGEKEIEIDVPDFETITEEYEAYVYDEDGNIIYDESGNFVTETKTREVIVPVMIEIEVQVPDYDKDGNIIGYHTEKREVQSTHKETVTIKTLVINPNWEEEQAEKEAQRVAMLHLTRGDVFRGLLLAKGVTRAQLRGIIEQLPEETNEQSVTKEMALIDFDEALDFYRGNALIDTVGAQLGITSEQMTKFFDKKDWHELVNEEE